MEFSGEKNLVAVAVFRGELARIVERIGVIGSSICMSAAGVFLLIEGVAACLSKRVQPAAITALLRSALLEAVIANRWVLVAGSLEEGRRGQLRSSAA